MKYIVVRESWEYNDEYYFQPEDEAYTITGKLLDTRKEAQNIADKMNERFDGPDYFTDYDGNKVKPFKVIEIDE